jgi:RNA polymerase sigma-70 factor (ECF subfamily)
VTSERAALEEVAPESSGWPEDACLVERLQSGEEAAYEQLVGRFQQPVYSLVCRLINDTGDASDVVQDVFLKVFRSIGSFRGQSSLKTWVYRIAVNEAHNRRRWFGRHRRPEVGLEASEDGEHGFLETLHDAGRSPYDLALSAEWRSSIEKALEGLNPVFRTAVVLRDVEELSYEEIAEVLEVSLGTVKSRILRGREALRKSLAEQCLPARTLEFTPQPAD